MPWYGRLSEGPELIQGGRLCVVDMRDGGGGLLAGAAGRGALASGVVAGPEVEPTDAGTGASPSSAMRDRYSLSIRALS